jgi:hypothetical protein
VHYVVLDDVFWYGEDYIGHLEAEQLQWLAADLRLVEPGRTVIVLLHIPAMGTHQLREGKKALPSFTLTNREMLLHLLEPYRAHLLAGHTHESEHGFGRGYHEHVAGPLRRLVDGPHLRGRHAQRVCHLRGGGGEGRLEVQGHGEAALPPDAPLPERDAAQGAGQVVANVWDWDPEWKVVWFEDGEARGPMERRRGTDPISEELFAGPDRPRKHTFVDPYATDHLFVARPRASAKAVTWRPRTDSAACPPSASPWDEMSWQRLKVETYRIRPATRRDLAVVLHHRRRMFEDMGHTDRKPSTSCWRSPPP